MAILQISLLQSMIMVILGKEEVAQDEKNLLEILDAPFEDNWDSSQQNNLDYMAPVVQNIPVLVVALDTKADHCAWNGMDILAVNELVKKFVLDMEIVHYNLVAVIDVDDCSFVELALGLRLCLKIILSLNQFLNTRNK